jgi:Skp family chaperone for outer membrane proteins
MFQQRKALFFIFCLFVVVPLASCSSNSSEKKQADKGAIDQFTDETAGEIVNHIQTPINAAKEVSGIANQRNAEIEGMRDEIDNE